MAKKSRRPLQLPPRGNLATQRKKASRKLKLGVDKAIAKQSKTRKKKK